MGEDKALISFLGKPLIQRVVERVSVLRREVLVITNQMEDYRFLNLPLHTDLWPEAGALGGLATALTVANQPLVANIACDMPFVNSDLIAAGYKFLLENTETDAVIPMSKHGFEPLHAIYRRESCLKAVSKALASGKRRMISWFDDAHIHPFSPEEVGRLDPEFLTFWNLNTPEEFKQAEALARNAGRAID
jgi:molybdopterin-guanine dinucleotide biosynthesis protein A